MIRSGFLPAIVLTALIGVFGNSGRCEETNNDKRYEIRGIIRQPLNQEGEILVEHEDVPGLMPSMTMPFTPQDHAEVAGLKSGDGVVFTLLLGDAGASIAQVRKIDPASVKLPVAAPRSRVADATVRRLKEGDKWPAFTLVDQNGQELKSADFANALTLLDFIFTSCAVPSYCPLITRNFAEVKSALGADADKSKVRLLSVSFDPKDTPEVLRKYAEAKGADWTFATGDPAMINKLTKAFAVHVEEEGGTYNHGLCTALIGPDGVILKLWRGNAWKSQEVVEAVRAALTTPVN